MRISKSFAALASGATLCFSLFVQGALAQTTPKPKLVVAIVVDQFRYDYLTRFRASYHGGLDMLLAQGAVFTNAYYRQTPTVTSVGHSIFLSGAMPSVSGIVGNTWYDRDEGKVVTSVCDWNEQTVGGRNTTPGKKCSDTDAASPRRLLVSTLGDELKNASAGTKVFGVSIKSRSAILPAGHRADGAFWFDDSTGNFVTSSYYTKELPGWAKAFNDQKLPAKYVDQKWKGFEKWDFRSEPGSKTPYAKLPASPWGNELIELFAEQVLTAEKLGQRDSTDLLTVSFSSNDYVGHRVGPNAPEVEDMAIRTDQVLAKLFQLIDQKVGLKNTVIVLTADHGVAPIPLAGGGPGKQHTPGGYISLNAEEVVNAALTSRFGKADWIIPGVSEVSLYLNHKTIEEFKTADGHKLDLHEWYSVARQALFSVPQSHVARVYSADQLESGVSGDEVAQAEDFGFYARRSGDLNLVYDPYFLPGTAGTTHFSPWGYDRHVPILFYGAGIKPGRYHQTIAVNDIAPTLATLLDIETPGGSSGRVLAEILK
jgi:predicted AlkP superfamily pyrophosphatase or phosphodiesterase